MELSPPAKSDRCGEPVAISIDQVLERIPIPVAIADHRGSLAFANEPFLSEVLPQFAHDDGLPAGESPAHESSRPETDQARVWLSKASHPVVDLQGIALAPEIRIYSLTEGWKVIISTAVGALPHAPRLALPSQPHARSSYLAAFAVHELASPLSAVIAALLTVQRSSDTRDDVHRAIGGALKATHSMARLLALLAELERHSPLPTAEVDVHALLLSEVDSCRLQAGEQHISVVTRCAHDLARARANEDALGRVFANVIRNALEQMPRGGTLTIASDTFREAGSTYLSIEVKDTGPGIPKDRWEQIFEPFFSTKANGRGLGLPFCRQVLREHGGDIRVLSGAPGRTSLQLRLPLL